MGSFHYTSQDYAWICFNREVMRATGKKFMFKTTISTSHPIGEMLSVRRVHTNEPVQCMPRLRNPMELPFLGEG